MLLLHILLFYLSLDIFRIFLGVLGGHYQLFLPTELLVLLQQPDGMSMVIALFFEQDG